MFPHDQCYNPAVATGMKVCFYAGCPISVPSPATGSSQNVDTLCLIQRKPQKFNNHEQELLRQFAGLLLLKREMTMEADKTESQLIADLLVHTLCQGGAVLHAS